MLDLFDLELLVPIEREVVAVVDDLLLRHDEALRRARAVPLGIPRLPPCEKVREVVLLDRRALVVEREAVGAHVVEPHVVGAAR